jgi:hypothetical protein
VFDHGRDGAVSRPVLDIGAALELLTVATQGRRMYQGGGDCLVAQALRAGGLEPVELEALRRGCVIRPDGRRGEVPIRLTLGALAVLDAAQRAEDSGLARDDVLAQANTVAARYLDLLPDSAFAAALSSATGE